MSLATILAIFGALGGTAGIAAVMKVWLDHKRGKRKQTDEVALALVDTLKERVDKLEDTIASERQRCDDELRIVRHRIQGWKQLFYSVLHVIDMPARQRKDRLEGVRMEMAALEEAEKAETGNMMGARQKGSGE